MIDPTPEQIEAAARAAYPATNFDDPELRELSDEYRARVSRALVAAAGAAPQEPSAAAAHDSIRRAIWGHQMIEPGGVVRANDAHALADKITAALAAPVQVDEDEIAGVINTALDAWEGEEPSEVFVSRAIVAHLRGEGR